MRVIDVRNAHEGLPIALKLLEQSGVLRDSRNGKVLVYPEPVTIVYRRPCERVIFWPERDANPFFHLAEALWMLSGRNDVELPARYAKQIATYSDNGETLHGAYGYRWRSHFGIDQLAWIGQKLKGDLDDRRCVLGIWDPRVDLTRVGKDLPCNTIATLQRNTYGALDLCVFQRSGDAIWGVLGANAVHLSLMQEYLALMIGCPVGSYHQVVSNFHAYVDVFEKLPSIRPDLGGYVDNPYVTGHALVAPLTGAISYVDTCIDESLYNADHGLDRESRSMVLFFRIVDAMMKAHAEWRTGIDEKRYTNALKILSQQPHDNDWIIAGKEWIQRRYDRWKQRFTLTGDERANPEQA